MGCYGDRVLMVGVVMDQKVGPVGRVCSLLVLSGCDVVLMLRGTGSFLIIACLWITSESDPKSERANRSSL